MHIENLGDLDVVVVILAVGVSIWIALRSLPGVRPAPRVPRAFGEDEIRAYDRALPKYFLVAIIALLDPVGLVTAIRADTAWNGIVWELYGFVALIFFLLCYSMSLYSKHLERKLRTDHR